MTGRRSARIARAAGAIVGLLAMALIIAACGGGDGDGGGDAKVDVKKGRELFTKNCASCHTLSDANANGTLGPNLDDAHLDRESIKRQIETGGGPMPANLVKGKDADTVAGYVAQVAGSGGGE